MKHKIAKLSIFFLLVSLIGSSKNTDCMKRLTSTTACCFSQGITTTNNEVTAKEAEEPLPLLLAPGNCMFY